MDEGYARRSLARLQQQSLTPHPASTSEQARKSPYPSPTRGEEIWFGEGVKRDTLPENAIQRARSLRRMATPAEQQLWRALKEAFPLVRFRRQVPIGPYIVDFLSHAHRLIVEVDGGQHAIQQGYDAARTRFLEGEGYCVLRFWNMDFAGHLDGVIEKIGAALVTATPINRTVPHIEGRAQ